MDVSRKYRAVVRTRSAKYYRLFLVRNCARASTHVAQIAVGPPRVCIGLSIVSPPGNLEAYLSHRDVEESGKCMIDNVSGAPIDWLCMDVPGIVDNSVTIT